MARVAVPVTVPSRSGVALPAATTGDPVNFHTVSNDGKTYVLVENTGATVSRTVTFRLSRTVDGLSVTPRAETVAIGETQIFGPFPVHDYGATMNVDVDNAELKLRVVRV